MIVRHLHTVHESLTVLGQPTAEMGQVRAPLVLADGRFPACRTWERRLAALPATLSARIGCLRRRLAQARPRGERGADEGLDRHPPLRPRRGPRLPVNAVAPPRA
jgi:hypothetical protein